MAALPIATNQYFDVNFQRPGVKLLPNEFFVTSDDMVLATVLGSCVAACLHDRTAGIGGMNHFMLPDDGGDPSAAASDSMRYGAYAMEVLINELIKGGARRERLEAKVFGGAAVLANMTTLNVGDRNSEFVGRYLALERIPVVAEDLRGAHPRKVVFFARSGQVMVKKLKLQQEPSVTEREQAALEAARARRHEPVTGHVELFGAAAAQAAGPASSVRSRVQLFGAPAVASAPRTERFAASPGQAPTGRGIPTSEEA
jgi:chemotaxis protein CheD